MSMAISRRQALQAAAGAAALPLVHIRSAGAAGRLSIGLWDHWVPAGNAAMKKLIDSWAQKNKVEVSVDFITSVGNKLQLTYAAEAQARTGHDAIAFFVWDVHNYQQALTPVDDVVEPLIKQYGALNPVNEYLSKIGGHWMAVPTSSGTQYKPSCARIGFFRQAGFDVQEAYPVKPEHTAMSDTWTWQKLLELAPQAKKANLPFALGLGQTTDSVDFVGALFRSFGAELVNGEGEITVDSDNVKAVLEYMARLAPHLPPDVYSYDDASNNRALISGKSSLIFNPPSAWAVAVRDNRAVGADSWTFPNPTGPTGRFVPYLPFFWGIWQFSKNQSAAKELLSWLCQREQVESLCNAVEGYDIPPFLSMSDFGIWSKVQPPLGTVYNYPIRPWHKSTPSIAAYPAPPEIAVQIYNRATMTTMIGKLTQGGQSMKEVIAWAKDELEGFTR
ncbi:MAG TPA: extracellular solute-binding protein [Acetobacteraceae bacterium]|nr:extracellular solute-binding protein [Acetobacteraceae bacterium]